MTGLPPKTDPVSDPCALGLVDLVAAIQRREVSAVEAIEACLARIDAFDGTLHAFCTMHASSAREEAARIDARIARGDQVGSLAGAPVAIKDLISTRGLRTTFGSPLYANHIPAEDDISVERLRAAGAIVIGKTNTSEFGYGAVGYNALFPATRNPWNTSLSPGGSSAGSAVAVVTKMVPLGLGSDGGGSIRVPAALCGAFGFKPAFGRVPLYPGCRDETLPGASGWEQLEHIGPITRSPGDAALAMSVLAGPAPQDRYSLPREIDDWRVRPVDRRWRIAYSPNLGFAPLDPEVGAIVRCATDRLAVELGVTIREDSPDVDDPQPIFEAIVALETDREGLRRMAAAADAEFGPALSRMLAQDWTADELSAGLFGRKRIVNQLWRFMRGYDFLLTPTVATAAFPAELDAPRTIGGKPPNGAGCAPLATIANLSGLPAASIPVGKTLDGLPVGLQVMGGHLNDLGVLSLCSAVERLFPQRPWDATTIGTSAFNIHPAK
jgi:aspartyl-tRNA(Asn)/glutamyl-tRNA(Gln) amidotransferase subunit A